MGFLEKFKDKTVSDVVDTAKEKVEHTVKAVAEDKGRVILTLLPLAATAFILMSGGQHSGGRDILPETTVINNYYYYGERSDKHAGNSH